jgi:hypothetical protein
MLRGTLIGNSEEKKKKPLAVRKPRIITFTINLGQCDRGSSPAAACGFLTRASADASFRGRRLFCIANNASQEEKIKWL